MSNSEDGKLVILKVGDSGATEAFTVFPGQTSTRFGGSTSTADTTTKDDGGWSTSKAVLKSGNISCSGNYTDNATTKLIVDAYLSSQDINCECILNAAGDKFTGSFTVTNWEISGDTSDVIKYSLELAPTGALVLVEGP